MALKFHGGMIGEGIMKKRFFILMIFILILAGCAKNDQEDMVLDTQAIKTEAVQTAVAEITIQAILNPSPTPIAAAATPEPVQTQTSEIEEGQVPLEDAKPTLTLTPVVEIYSCEIDESKSQPANIPQKASAEFIKTWTVRNTGNIAWSSANVRLKWVGGINLSDADQVDWLHRIEPGQTVELNVDIRVPNKKTVKSQVVGWGLVNEQNEIFCKLYLVIPYVN